MENSVFLPDKMNHPGFRVFPVFFPFRGQVFRGRDIPDRGIKPHVKHFSLGSLDWNGYSPIQVTGHRTRLQTVVQPRFTLPVNIWFPLFMFFQNPLFQPAFILIQRQLPVLCFFQFRFVSRDRGHRINLIGSVQASSTSLTLIPVCPFVTAMRTFPHDITVCQKLPCLLVVELHRGLFDKFSLVIQLLEKSGR